MSITGSAINRLRARVDTILEDAFPVTLLISGQQVTGSGPGGRTTTTFIDGGEPENFRFSFRVPRSAVPAGWVPVMGGSVDWIVSATETIPMEIREVSTRPHENRFAFACQKRRVA
jgi:hypothetical protein